MACYTTQTAEVNTGKMHPEMLMAALEQLKLYPAHPVGLVRFNGGQFDITSGVLTLYGQNIETRTQEIKRAYSAQVVQSQAKKYGWQVKQTGPNQYQLLKR